MLMDLLLLCRAVQDVWTDRWEKMHSPIHGAAYCLDPEFWFDAGKNDECWKNLLTVMKKMHPDPEQYRLARANWSTYVAREGAFAFEEALEDAEILPAHQWWESYGQGTPQLKHVAMRVLAQVSSACACERNWSTYDFIHSKKRNKLTPARARDLVYVFTNQRLVDKLHKVDNEETFPPWDAPSEEDEEEMQVLDDAAEMHE